MFKLALRTLRLRKGGFLATFVAVFFGALVVSACGGLMETGIRSETPVQRLAAAPIVVGGQQTLKLPEEDPATLEPGDKHKFENATLPERVRLDAGLAGRLRAVPGVTNVVGEISFPAQIGAASVLGHAWDSAVLTPYALSGQAPKPGEVVVDAGLGLAVGDTLPVAAHGSAGRYRISGIAHAPQAMQDAAVFFAASDAERLSGYPGRFDTIGVFGGDVAAVTAAVGDAGVVATGVDRGAFEFPETGKSGENLIVLAAVSGGLSALVMVFVVAGTLTLSTQQRQRELALLRAVGTTPRQLRRMVLGEALVVGLLAVGLAVVLGPVLGEWLFDQLAGHHVVPDVLRYEQGWVPALVAAGASLLAVVGASFVAGRRASRIRPTEALAEAAVERRWLTPIRLVVAILCFAGGTALGIVTVAVMTGPVAASTAGPAVMLWAFGLAAISPGVTKLMATLLRWPVEALTGVNGRVALRNTRVGAVRAAGAVTPIMLAVGIATANIYLQTTQEAVSNQAYTEDLRADAVVAGPSGLDPAVAGRVRAVPGVAGASEYVTSTVFVEKPFDSGQHDDGRPALGVSELTGNVVEVASTTGHHVGDTLSLRLGDGTPVDVRVTAVVDQRPGFERLVLPAELLAPHTTLGLAPQLLVRAAPGVDPATLTARLREATAGLPVSVGDRGALIAAHAKGNEVGAWVNYLLVGMILAYTVISVVNTLVTATARRRREFGVQRLSGFTRGQVLRMAGVEGGLIATIAVLLGTLVAAGAIVPFCLVVTGSLLPSGPVTIYLAVLAIAVVLSLAAILVPAWAATRGRAVDATSVGE
ncbi:ABC transporter permease [Amycolatopsis mediterranei S699]|uniref:ABC transport system permease protein n=2 Tax=Amycolatopsis mediterranei TaxID=33910 RepID=A0A0H3DMC9_AMYMU|nr:ABC transporter permease [Amycolatopsis mediterranei]ADJ50839.1 ABC transport system permease protein [Amycolatopsis mediterranei U32]AEK47851.1 ABC transporter permease [Amycolatopsis mediterranei S699]AFO82545.1 ABC transporter permease [Amycolatopsis mediterranei S699]AGT89674.1 ABC transporter permease [Amycolatopsis mediterranei RB]KDO12167.1 ABC transporter permease [Amycolatopsis mediterranei]